MNEANTEADTRAELIDQKLKSCGCGVVDGSKILRERDVCKITAVGANNYSPLRSPSKTIGSMVRGYKIGVTKWFRITMNNLFPVGNRFGNEIIMNISSAMKNH